MTQSPDFKKFAAELVSSSELFEPLTKKTQAGMHESLELLGSLASLTHSSLFKNSLTPGNPMIVSQTKEGPLAQTARANPVRYETSKPEYRQALGDQKIIEALALLQNQNRQSPGRSAQSSLAKQSTQLGQAGFQNAVPKEVSASIKPSSTTRRSGIFSPILRTSE